MLTDVVIGKYIVSNSEVHKLNPTFKILSLIIMLISTLFINSYEDIIMLFSYLFLSLVCSGIGLKVYLKEFLKFKVIFLIIVIINIITYNTIEIILSDILRLIFIILYTSLFTHTTTFNELLYGIEMIVDPLEIKRNRIVILYICLITRFPRVFKKKTDKTFKILYERRINNEKKLHKKIYYYKKSITKSFNMSVEELNDMAYIMKARLYGYGKSRTNYRLKKFGIKEGLLLVLNIIILFIVIFY